MHVIKFVTRAETRACTDFTQVHIKGKVRQASSVSYEADERQRTTTVTVCASAASLP